MKKVFLSLAFVAALTVVSCNKAAAPAEGGEDTTVVETPAVDTNAVDTNAVDTNAVDTTAKK